MRTFRFSLLLTTIALLLGGCLAAPKVMQPGTEAQQVKRAQRFDPYPEPGVAPNIVGGRPSEFGSPRAEVRQAQERPGEASLAE